MEKRRVLLISGMSGAGKSSAMSMLEDMGYHCIDSFPVQLLDLLTDLIESSSDIRYNFTALATSAGDFPEFIRAFKNTELDVRVLFLDASNDVLLQRYKSTRRTHPLLISNVCKSLEKAIQTEREMFINYKDRAFLTLDTTFLSFKELKFKIESYFSKAGVPAFTISFISFGYKHGVPLDADLMFDVRFLPNPYWDVNLRPYSGDDKIVYDFVMEKPQTIEYVKILIDFLDYSFKQYVSEGKNHLTVGIGCTGGQHRSVSIVNYLYDFYNDKYNCFKGHRDKVGLDNEK